MSVAAPDRTLPPVEPTPLLPRLDEVPQGFRWTAIFLALNAWVMLLPASAAPWAVLPGQPAPDLPGAFGMWWLLFERGFTHITHTRANMYPAIHDQFTAHGFPLDAFLGWPLASLFGITAAFTISVWAYLTAAGVSMAWLAGRWWKSNTAALAGGLAYQTANIFIREICEGRPTHLLGAAFVPLTIGLAMDATDRGALPGGLGAGTGSSRLRRDVSAVLCGVTAACTALAYWYYGAFIIALLVTVAAATLPERRQLMRPILLIILSGLTVAGLPVAYTVMAASGHAGAELGLFSTFRIDGLWQGGRSGTLIDLLDGHDLGNAQFVFRPVLIAAAMYALRAQRRRTLLPLVWLVVATLFAMGPVLQVWHLFAPPFALPGPFATLGLFPLLRRFWWPDRMLFIAALGTSMLAAGGMARFALNNPRAARWATAGLVIEMWLNSTHLPIDSTDLRAGDLPSQVKALKSGNGPLLVLPFTTVEGHTNLDFFILQPLYGRPTVNGNMRPGTGVAPDAYTSLFQLEPKKGPLAALFACEVTEEPFADEDWSTATWLKSAGVKDVYLHVERGQKIRPNYIYCAERLLGKSEPLGPFLHYALD